MRSQLHVGLFVLGYVLGAIALAFLILDPVRAYDQDTFAGLWLAVTIVTAPIAFLYANNQRQLAQERSARRSDKDLDHLTGLLNRGAFFEQVRSGLQNRPANTTYALLMIELDHFIELSELYGSRTADRVLRHSASALEEAVRDSDLLSRLDGEVFCLFVKTLDADSLAAFTRRLLRTVQDHPYSSEGSILELSASCGYTLVGPQDTVDEALSQARSSLINAKRAGGDRSVLYSHPDTTLTTPGYPPEVA